MANNTNDDFYCTKHGCKKTWMMQNSFCPQCESDKAMGFDVDFEMTDFEVTIPAICNCKFPVGSLTDPKLCLKCFGRVP